MQVAVQLVTGEEVIGKIVEKWEDGLWVQWTKNNPVGQTKVSYIAYFHIKKITRLKDK